MTFCFNIPRKAKETKQSMKKFKQNTYTCLLLATCFVASPFIFHRIWETSSEVAKKVDVPPPIGTSETVPGEDPVSDPDDTSAAQPTPDGTPVDPALAPPTPTAAVESVYTFVSSDASYFDDALFIGDSRTVGIEEYGTLTNADYFCSVGMMSSKIDEEYINGMNFDQLIDSKQYGKIYLMLGINEVGNDFQYTLTQYRAVVERLKAHQPDAIIYVQGNLHVSASAQTNVISNERINYLNSLIESLADNKKVFYIDINEVYDDAYGCLTEEYTSDGVHPLAMYYKQWCDWLCTKTISAAPAPNAADVAVVPDEQSELS